MKLRQTLALTLAVISIILTLTACGNGTQNQNSAPSTLIPQNHNETTTFLESQVIEAQQKTTLKEMSSTGQITFDNLDLDRYKKNHIHPDCSGLLPFKYNFKYGYIDEHGNVVIDNIYDSVGMFSEGKALVEHGENIEIIDTSGSVLYSFPRSEIKEEYWSPGIDHYFQNGYLIIDNSEDEIIKVFDSECNEIEFSDIKGVYYGKSSSGVFGLMDYAGNVLIETSTGNPPLDNLYRVYDSTEKTFFAENGYANICNNDDKWGLYEINSKTLAIDYKYDYVGMYSDGVVPVASYSKWGLVDLDGNTLIPCNTYTYIGPFSNGRAFAAIDNNGYIIDKQGNILLTISGAFLSEDYYVYPFTEKNTFTIIETKKRLYIMNMEGEIIFNSDRHDIIYINEDYVVFDDKLYKFIIE